MKIITVAGAHRSVGKTTFARYLKDRLPGTAEIIKIGHGTAKPKPEKLFHTVTEALRYLEQVRADGFLDYLIVESNRIAGHLEPDLAIFLESTVGTEGERDTSSGEKAVPVSAGRARESAHIMIAGAGSHGGQSGGDPATRRRLYERLSLLDSLSDGERKAVLAARQMFFEK
jgi:hypothetical protein